MGNDDASGSLHPDDNRCVFSSNTTGNSSYTYEETGSILLQSLYQVLSDKANHDLDFIDIQTMIGKKVNNKKITLKDSDIEVKAKMDFETTMSYPDMKKIKFTINKSKQDYELIHIENKLYSKQNKNIQIYCICYSN